MTMRAYYVGPLKHGARMNLDKYYDRPFDVFKSYYEVSEGWMPDGWWEKLGKGKQMDWGSDLYVCDRKLLEELMKDITHDITPITPAKKGETLATRHRQVPVSKIPKQTWYGILQAELY